MPETPTYPIGSVINGNRDAICAAYDRFHSQPIDLEFLNNGNYPYSLYRTTLGGIDSCSGPGTFQGAKRSTLTFGPSQTPGPHLPMHRLITDCTSDTGLISGSLCQDVARIIFQ